MSNNPPNKVLSVDEFLTLRHEVLQLLKQYDTPLTDATPPGEDDAAPPGEEPPEAVSVVSGQCVSYHVFSNPSSVFQS